MSIQSGTFCWQGITTDNTTGPAFYKRVLDWNLQSGDGGPVFIAPGGAVAHLQAPGDTPPSWCTFLSVDDLDASTAKASAHGSAVIVPPTDLPAGRFSVVTTPTGAVFALYQSAEADEMAKPGPGTIHWVELQSIAIEDDLEWFKKVFGFTVRTQQMATGPYHVLESDGTPRGGVSASHIDRSVFLAWVHVADLDDTLAKVEPAGGTVTSAPFADPDVGRMAVVADPSGAVYGLVQPNGR